MNPLRLDKAGPDTRQAVRDVLFFVVDAILAISATDVVARSESATRGVAHVLIVCADALRDDDDEGAT